MLAPSLRLLLLSILFCVGGAAQVAEVTVAAKRSTFSDGDLGEVGLIPQSFELEDGSGVNLILSMNGRSLFGHELTYGFERDSLSLGSTDQGSVTVHKFYYDFVVHMAKSDSPVRPFVFGGVGLSNYGPPAGAAIQARNLTKFGANFGGGIKVRLHEHFGLRFDVRDLVHKKPNFFDLVGVDGTLHNVEYAVGASWLF